MDNRLLHTPEGVRDIYGEELYRKQQTEDKLLKLTRTFGYRQIETPTFDFFDIFSGGTGTTPSREIFKFFDSENNTLALRPDFTPGAARAAAKYFMEGTEPVRLSYLGHTFSNRSDLQGKLKEVTELGLEYMGEPSADADAEMIFLSTELLKAAGLKDFMICIGNSEYFRGICEAAGLKPETISELSDNIRNKNYFGTLDMLNDIDMDDGIRETLHSFSDFFGGTEILEEAEKKVRDIPRSFNAVKRLKEIYDRLKLYGVDSLVSFDLGMLSKHYYYTGMTFRAYTFGTGEPIVRGGRYDNLLENFGKKRAAVGFTMVMDQLMDTLKRQHITENTAEKRSTVFYRESSFTEALEKSRELRSKGIHTAMTRVDEDFDPEEIKMNSGENEEIYLI